jgi:DNA (cytosine-5)-methyltransferase 1
VSGLIIDGFAGGGGASEGIEIALGRSPDIAINHDTEAVAMHAANHPSTRHLCGDVWDADPAKLCSGEPVALAWFSPDCKHHSKAKGGKPRDAKIRALAWVVIRWARTVKPRIICLENVEEFADWGPLHADGSPIESKKGLTFRIWLGKLKAAGYVVEMRELRACDYGAPTTRKRLFVIARCDGQPIVWPRPTHGPGTSTPFRTAAECIDWSLPCPSIFERKKPLADKTLRRIARGIRKFVLESASPFIVPTAHAGDARVHSIDEPLRTITGSRRGDHAIVAPTLIQTGYGEREGQAPRSLDLHQPLGTVVGCGQKHALVAAFLSKHNGGHEATGSQLDLPAHTITARDHHALTTAFITRFYGTGTGSSFEQPLPTVTAQGEHFAQVRAFLARYNGDAVGQSAQLPLGSVTTARRFGLVMVHGEPYEIADIGMRMLQPRELFRAQGFADSYVIDPIVNGKPLTKTAQIRCCGNSVCPPLAAAIVGANVRRLAEVA